MRKTITKLKYLITVICGNYIYYDIYLPYLPLLLDVFFC